MCGSWSKVEQYEGELTLLYKKETVDSELLR